jgi:hypothetical protein
VPKRRKIHTIRVIRSNGRSIFWLEEVRPFTELYAYDELYLGKLTIKRAGEVLCKNGYILKTDTKNGPRMCFTGLEGLFRPDDVRSRETPVLHASDFREGDVLRLAPLDRMFDLPMFLHRMHAARSMRAYA